MPGYTRPTYHGIYLTGLRDFHKTVINRKITMKISSLFTIFAAVSAGGFKERMKEAVDVCQSDCETGPELKIPIP